MGVGLHVGAKNMRNVDAAIAGLNINLKLFPEDYREDMDAYMDSVTDDRLYSRMNSKEFVRQAIDADEVFRLAIGFEKYAFLYFMEFLPYLTAGDQKIVADMIAQEKDHIRKLVQVKKQLENS